MVTTQLIVDVMTFFDDKKTPEIPQEVQQPYQEEALIVQPQPPENVEAGVQVEPEVEEAQDVQSEIVSSDVQEADDEPPDLVDAPDYDSDDGEEDEEDESDEEENEPETGIASRTRRQTGAPMNPPPRYTMASVKINKKKESGERLKAIEKADKDEIEQLFVDLRGVVPEFKENIKGPVYRCHMFEIEKFLATGDHDKFKSRLVFDGSAQDPSLFPDRSSPTVALHSLMACLALAASNGMTKIGKIDVKGAFIQTEMVGPPVYIKCDPGLTKLIVEVLPAIKKYVTAEGTLYCRLLKALYGCVQASKLWYNKLTAFLRSLGYEHSPTDPCVLRKIVDGKVYLLTIYVDDILVFADENEVTRIKEAFVKEYQWITMEVSDAHSYLGMQIMLRDGAAVIDMTNFAEKLLLNCGEENLREFTSPAGKDLFNVNEQAVALTEQERKKFHTNVAKLLYLTKRARPDVLTAVGFLCTRVTRATVQDKLKLRRVLGYLKRTKKKTLHLKIGDLKLLKMFVDAAFATHPDAKSQTGVAVFMGEALLFAASRKQKCVSKSPTDSELIALSDNTQFAELFAEFLAFIMNTKYIKPLIYEDCTAVISLVTEGRGVVRTKHLRVRMELVKQALQDNRIIIEYINTKQMLADGLTKALEGEDFIVFAESMLGTTMA